MNSYKKPEIKPVLLWGKNNAVSTGPIKKKRLITWYLGTETKSLSSQIFIGSCNYEFIVISKTMLCRCFCDFQMQFEM